MLKNKNIVCTGPESSGKSTLVAAIAKHFDLPHLDEYAREYLSSLYHPYTQQDVLKIGDIQLSKEKNITDDNKLSVLDTDWLTIEIWFQEKYGISSGIKQNIEGKVYLLLYPDIPWKSDPLRENPDDRLRLFYQYEKYLIRKNAFFFTVKNNDDGRIQSAIDFLKDNIIFT